MMVKQVSLGSYHTIICIGDGVVYTVGNWYNGQLGQHGDRERKTTPVLVQALVESKELPW